MPTLSFAHTVRYGPPRGGVRAGTGTRAYVWFAVINPATGAASRREFGLLDSGCDECFLDTGILSGTGLALGASISVAVAGGGSVAAYVVPGVDLEIEGVRLTGVDIHVGTTGTPLVGRRLYLRAFDVAFTGSDWLHA